MLKKGLRFRQTAAVADINGRNILMSGELYGNPIIPLNIYRPNFDDPEFYKNVYCLIPEIPEANG